MFFSTKNSLADFLTPSLSDLQSLVENAAWPRHSEPILPLATTDDEQRQKTGGTINSRQKSKNAQSFATNHANHSPIGVVRDKASTTRTVQASCDKSAV
ncbi:unnamed protein product [Bursaphelenchus xylophilus]|uniref:(pine wood nematode) hypothetical protein n=1 Tax=Bursaphelenchus xylophilus TaxID=6326 RepID=A0A1I7S2C9_BURXY|nr:unnamed protein product [Bursaphelenchus xylophilus]CAG9114665.1 unnamed protein product [Bursaphelenchus xylophilus]